MQERGVGPLFNGSNQGDQVSRGGAESTLSLGQCGVGARKLISAQRLRWPLTCKIGHLSNGCLCFAGYSKLGLSFSYKKKVPDRMSLPLLVVDDSSFSRRMIIRALPESWDVNVTQACNGVEALDALKNGSGEVMFLDLTMPILDGYGVLESVRAENIQTKVIVLSADIQPKAEERVKALGALAFVKKPFSKESLAEVLANCGIYSDD